MQFSKKQLLSIIKFISRERLNSETADELKRIEEEEQKADRSKIVYVFLLMVLKQISLIFIWQPMNKITWQTILKILKIRQDPHIILI